MPKNPGDYPIIIRDGQTYSFLDCVCKRHCLKRDCIYCAFEIEGSDCPGAE